MYEEYKKLRIGLSKQMNNGIIATCIDYRNINDITIRFEDGTVLKHRRWYDFEKGCIGHPLANNQASLQELIVAEYFKPYGFVKAPRCSLKKYGFNQKELDLYNENINGFRIAIEYDGGQKKYHSKERDLPKNQLCYNNNIILIRIREPQLEKYSDKNVTFFYRKTKRDNKDLFNVCHDIEIYLNRKYGLKLKQNAKIDINSIHKINNFHRIGERNLMHCGKYATIIAYRKAIDIDIQFDDGTIVKNRTYKNFIIGNIAHPAIKDKKVLKSERNKRYYQKKLNSTGNIKKSEKIILRQNKIIKLLSIGLTMKDVCSNLNISERTYYSDIKHITTKQDIANI